MEGLLEDVEAGLDGELGLELDATQGLDHDWVVCIVQQRIYQLAVHSLIALHGRFKQVLNEEKCLIRIFSLLYDRF